ncbi:VOC family protein [Bacillus sp. Marseille-Q3570]|uniref:VOC family protein n=1 Tax=Bacillus sp. Marseille-Q3570 TaxID=2963522 RepID=UPI0021B80961|nr:VOC family protein [Bacillus sp. Marseille-Q3570]
MKITKSPINRVGTTFVHVQDLKKTARWYAELLGKETPQVDPDSPVHYVDLGNGGFLLDDDRNNEPGTEANLMLHTDDIDEAYAFVKEKGGIIVREIERFPDVSFFNFKDPDGNVLMICEEHHQGDRS